MDKSKYFFEILDQLKAIMGQGNYIDNALKMNSYFSDWRN